MTYTRTAKGYIHIVQLSLSQVHWLELA